MCFHSVLGGGKAYSAANLPTDSSREEAEYMCKLLWAIGPLSPGVTSKSAPSPETTFSLGTRAVQWQSPSHCCIIQWAVGKDQGYALLGRHDHGCMPLCVWSWVLRPVLYMPPTWSSSHCRSCQVFLLPTHQFSRRPASASPTGTSLGLTLTSSTSQQTG